MNRKKSKTLIVSAVLGLIYSIYLIVYFSGIMNETNSSSEAVGSAIATVLVTPHMLCVAIAAIFNTIAVFNFKRGFALVGAILYSAGAIIFLPYAFFVIPMIILSFIGFANLKKINALNQESQI